MTNTVLREPSELVERMTDEQIKHMVQRFLCWKLPEHFCPDAGISFDPVFNKGTPYEMRHQPIGTNLFGYDEAKAMVRFMLEGLPASPTPEPSLREALTIIADEQSWKGFSPLPIIERMRETARAALSASPAEPQEATEAMVVQVIAQVLWEKVGPMISAPRAADIARDIYAAMRSAASGGDTV